MFLIAYLIRIAYFPYMKFPRYDVLKKILKDLNIIVKH